MSVIAQAKIEASTQERRLCAILRFQRDGSLDWRPPHLKAPFSRMALPAFTRNGILGTLRSPNNHLPALVLTSLLATLTNHPSRNSFRWHSYVGNNILDSVSWSGYVEPCQERVSA
jgi:hypothetical protein